jgi:pyruvate dehydrogenase E1 component alpha subunit
LFLCSFSYLTDLGAWDEKKEAALLDDAATKVDVAVQKYLNTPKAAIESMFDYMYATLPESLQEQRAHALRYKDSGGGAHG